MSAVRSTAITKGPEVGLGWREIVVTDDVWGGPRWAAEFDPRLTGRVLGTRAAHTEVTPSMVAFFIRTACPGWGLGANRSGVLDAGPRTVLGVPYPLPFSGFSWNQSPLHVPVSWEPGSMTRRASRTRLALGALHAWAGLVTVRALLRAGHAAKDTCGTCGFARGLWCPGALVSWGCSHRTTTRTRVCYLTLLETGNLKVRTLAGL